jgi:drug/metabolite transporter (DMT)-like permease
MGKSIGAYLEMALAMVIVGGSVVAGKLIVASFPVFLASGLRFAIGSLILVPLLIKVENGFGLITKKDWLVMFFQAFTGVFLFSIFLLYGLKFTSAAEGGIITSTTPAAVGLISILFLRERLTLNSSLGISFAVLGILTVNVLGTTLAAARGTAPLLGNLLILAAVIGEALFIVLGKVSTQSVSPLTTATGVNVLGLFMFLPFFIYEASFFDFLAVRLADWLPILYYGVFLTVIAFILWFQGVSKVPASTAAVFTGIMPVSAVLLSYLVLNEPFSWAHVAGGLFVLLGIGFITRG